MSWTRIETWVCHLKRNTTRPSLAKSTQEKSNRCFLSRLGALSSNALLTLLTLLTNAAQLRRQSPARRKNDQQGATQTRQANPRPKRPTVTSLPLPVLTAVTPAMLETFTTDEPPLAIAPSASAAVLRRGCSSWCACKFGKRFEAPL